MYGRIKKSDTSDHRSGRVALLKVDGAVLKGVDSAGNKYWEKMQDQHGRTERDSFLLSRRHVLVLACGGHWSKS